MTKLREKIWIWGHTAGVHNEILGKSSRMTAAEAAYYLGVRNMIMVKYWGKPELPYDQEAMALDSMDQVIWSIVGCSPGMPNKNMEDLNEVLRLSKIYPNITGGILDDFFVDDRTEERERSYTPGIIADTRRRMNNNPGAPLDLWVVLYEYQLEKDIKAYIDEFNGVTFWTWYGSNLDKMNENYAKLRTLAGDKRILLGCYMYDYGENKELTAREMELQLGNYRKLLKNGDTEGIILLSNTIADLGLEAVEYTKQWIKEYGDEVID